MTKPFERDDSIKLGDTVKDRITGVSGVVIAITECLNGCRRHTIQPKDLHQGRPVDSISFDAERSQL